MDVAGDVEKEQKLSGGKHTETKKENVLEWLVPNLMKLELFLRKIMGKKSRVNMYNMDRHLLRAYPKALLTLRRLMQSIISHHL